MRLTIPLGSGVHVPMFVRPSALILSTVVMTAMAVGALPRSAPGSPAAVYWFTGALTAVLLLASVVVHEVAHAATARRQRIEARRVVVSLFGGSTELTTDPPTPRAEFLISAAGPGANLAIAVLSVTVILVGNLVAMPVLLSVALVWLTIANVLLAVLNLLPGESMDGGQMLMALLWHKTGDRDRATVSAARVGRVVGLLLVLGGLALVLATGFFSGIWLILPGFLLVKEKHPATTAPAGESAAGRHASAR